MKASLIDMYNCVQKYNRMMLPISPLMTVEGKRERGSKKDKNWFGDWDLEKVEDLGIG